MSTTLVSSIYEMDILYQNQKNNASKTQFTSSSERKIVGNSMNLTRNRNVPMPIGSNAISALNNFIQLSSGHRVNGTNPTTDDGTMGIFVEHQLQHRKFERSLSDQRTVMDQERFNQHALNSQRTNINTSRYKTELCRPFEESGYCKYSDKCQFAHGLHELRSLARHPKYKTEPCRTFHTIGFCPYGARCHFIHSEDEKKLNQIVNKNQQAQMNQVSSVNFHQQQCQQQQVMRNSPPPQRPDSISLKFNFSCRGSMGSSLDSSSPPSSVTDSPPSLSPTCWTEDFHPLCNNSSNPSPTQSLSGNSSASPSPVFNYNGSNTDSTALPSLMTPLNVQTQLNTVNNSIDLNLFAQQFHSILKINNGINSNQSVFSGDSSDFTRSPPSPPDSISSDSIGSTNSVPSYGSYVRSNTCASPLEVGKNLRLPIFNQLSHEG